MSKSTIQPSEQTTKQPIDPALSVSQFESQRVINQERDLRAGPAACAQAQATQEFRRQGCVGSSGGHEKEMARTAAPGGQ
eukprot:scaffold166064_cov35-Prasinocladus_malaysianus.AAC.2